MCASGLHHGRRVEIIRAHVTAYADDVTVLIAGADIDALVRSAKTLLKTAEEAFMALGMPLSPKAAATLISLSRKQVRRGVHWPIGTVAGQPIVLAAKSTRVLGLTIDPMLNLSEHAAGVANACAAELSCLRRLRDSLHPRQLAQLYEGSVLSRLLFAAPLWWPLMPIVG